MLVVKKIILSVIGVLSITGVLFSGSLQPVYAQGANESENQLNAAGGAGGAGLTATDPRWIIGNIINIFLSLVGVILLCFIFYAGYLWLTAAGNDEQVEHAKTIIKNAIIGLLVVLVSFSLTFFIMSYANLAVSGNPNGARSVLSPPLPPR